MADSVYKHDKFIADSGPFNGSSIKGFSVASNIAITDYEAVRNNFRSDFVAILLIKEGDVTVKLNLEKHELTKNSLLLTSPWAIKQLVSANEECLISAVSFTADFLNKIGLPENKIDLFDYLASRFSPHWKLSATDVFILSEILNQLEQRTNQLNDHLYGQELLRHTFFILLYELGAMSRKYLKTDNPDFTRKEALVMNFVNMVHAQFRQLRNVNQYAAQLHVTPKYLTETVKEQTGQTAGEIIDDAVMLEAKLLLDNPDLSISQVAALLHFSDQSFFGKFFKRHSGVSPKEYRLSL
jgi:AraC family transcriptional regulator, transcriptional activator of pobA